MSLIITVCFTMLLAIGAACATYEKTDDTIFASATLVQPSPQNNTVGDDDDSAHAGPRGDAVLDSAPGTSALVGSALCALGVMCGLVFAILRKWLLQRPTPLDRVSVTFVLPSIPAPFARPRASALSLTQLSLSRI
ncbi:hypothetical protein DC31_05975 [Microbacterium sp. CH12i]|nr:hypothetical protein DC31_05975 [Microbacterium sp. CH12i]